jgi:hypothetical protein
MPLKKDQHPYVKYINEQNAIFEKSWIEERGEFNPDDICEFYERQEEFLNRRLLTESSRNPAIFAIWILSGKDEIARNSPHFKGCSSSDGNCLKDIVKFYHNFEEALLKARDWKIVIEFNKITRHRGQLKNLGFKVEDLKLEMIEGDL